MKECTGFQQPISNEKHVDCAALPNVRPVHLVDMAQKALSYLTNNPLPEHGYQCRFSFAPLNCPPLTPDKSYWNEHTQPDLIDPITVGDTESRNDVAFNMMRLMTGDRTTGTKAEEAVHNRLLGYIRRQGKYAGLCWHRLYSSCVSDGRDWASLWSTGMLLQSECDRYRLNPEQHDLNIASGLFEGLLNAAIRENGFARFPAGLDFSEEGQPGSCYGLAYSPVMGALCEYWEVSGDSRCLKLLYEMAEGWVRDFAPNLHREDGGVDGHNHLQLHALRGMAQFAQLTGEPRYLNWIKDIYDYYRRWALDTGWLPESRDLEDHSNHSETCLNGDMHEVECRLALAGYDDLWDRVERSVRNYFVPAQFALTPEIEAIYREVNADKPAREVENGLRVLRELEGGFLSALTPNDAVFSVREGGAHWGSVVYKDKTVVLDMMGCCPPEGMRAIYYTWKFAVTKCPAGIAVHLPFDVDTPLATVESKLPEAGQITVRPKKAETCLIRVPQWVLKERVSAARNGESLPVEWSGPSNAYVLFENAVPGDVLTIRYPLLDMVQKVTVTPYGQKEQRYSYHWVGNSVESVSPAGEILPLYAK